MVRHFEPMIYFREAGVALFKDITVLFWAGGSFFLKPEPPVFFARAARFFCPSRPFFEPKHPFLCRSRSLF